MDRDRGSAADTDRITLGTMGGDWILEERGSGGELGEVHLCATGVALDGFAERRVVIRAARDV